MIIDGNVINYDMLLWSGGATHLRITWISRSEEFLFGVSHLDISVYESISTSTHEWSLYVRDSNFSEWTNVHVHSSPPPVEEKLP